MNGTTKLYKIAFEPHVFLVKPALLQRLERHAEKAKRSEDDLLEIALYAFFEKSSQTKLGGFS